MKITFEILGILLLAVAAFSAVRFLLERRRQKQVDATGTIVYATLISTEPVKMFGRFESGVVKVLLRVQEPGETTAREVTLRTRLDAKQKLTPGMKIPVGLDPKDKRRLYPASPEAAKRAVLTGSRLERRAMESVRRTPSRAKVQPPKTGYMPPNTRPRPRG